MDFTDDRLVPIAYFFQCPRVLLNGRDIQVQRFKIISTRRLAGEFWVAINIFMLFSSMLVVTATTFLPSLSQLLPSEKSRYVTEKAGTPF